MKTLSVLDVLDVINVCQGKRTRDQFAINLKPKDLKSSWSLEKNNNELMIKQVLPDGRISWIEIDDQEKAKNYFNQ